MSSSLRVLIVGRNPNVLLYASRFQLAKSIELYHINDSQSSSFHMETFSYGKEHVYLKNKFETVPNLLNHVEKTGTGNFSFDLILLSATSLQEISTIATQLNSVINKNTKIIVESSGFVQLEPFVKISIEVPNLHIFSVLTNFDIREVSADSFKQFSNSNNATSNTLYLGSTQPSSGHAASSHGLYPKNVSNLLDTFERLFSKLFPKDTVNLCSYSDIKFLSQQWAIAIPKICFDPLLIMLDEQSPRNLPEQILAKPLLSGLTAELLAVAKSMGASLPSSMDTESNSLKHWQDMYPNADDVPSLVYHFLKRTSSLDLDILLLQPILLADDNGIKTPYLEFLYSILCQFQKINRGDSKLFIRADTANNSQTSEVQQSSEELDYLKQSYNQLLVSQQEKDILIDQLKHSEVEVQTETENLKTELANINLQLKEEVETHERDVADLKNQISSYANQLQEATEALAKSTSATSQVQEQRSEAQYTQNGTPILNDFEDLAVYEDGTYESPPIKQTQSNPFYNSENQQAQQKPQSQQTQNFKDNMPPNKNQGMTKSNSDVERIIKRRELELRKKELDLQERELELQKRAMQQRQSMQQQPSNYNHNKGLQPAMNTGSRKSSYSQLQQPFNSRQNRSMYGASSLSAGNFVDPAGHGQGMTNSSTFPPNLNQPPQQHGMHAFKPTSRKNKNGNLSKIGSASSSGFANMNGAQNVSQSRMNSMSTQSLPVQNRGHPAAGPVGNNVTNPSQRMNMPRAVAPNTFSIGNQPIALATQQQRQYSAGTTESGNPNMSMGTVVHTPVNLSDPNESMQNGKDTSMNGGQPMPPKAPDLSVPSISISSSSTQNLSANLSSNTNSNSNVTATESFAQTPNEQSVSENTTEPEKPKEKKKKFKFFGKKNKN